ncbi:iron-containing redox enzyme family protein [Natronoglycomyces albus]|uniref:Iron-containing redox enzyme family protein n=1 Tax=Natronoglycomyces albus TaxID=2811108 RepID=A0A895XTS4_9ACTN|nr:iron-containing redox enzyme family protein [Natronoglycomyces albus]QSB06883.1 iron-containing redox enzyme family protein [Natronoglycomyces albus]
MTHSSHNHSPAFDLPDTSTSLPIRAPEVSPEAVVGVERTIAASAPTWFGALLRDIENEQARWLSRRLAHGFLHAAANDQIAQDLGTNTQSADEVVSYLLERAETLGHDIARLRGQPQLRYLLRERAPIALLGPAWLDTVSQPASEPAVIVNRLGAHRFAARGEGTVELSTAAVRRRELEAQAIALPDLLADDFCTHCESRDITTAHAAVILALSLNGASLLPEIVGAHCAASMLAVDDKLLGTTETIPAEELADTLRTYWQLCEKSATGKDDWQRMLRGATLLVTLETYHVRHLSALAQWHAQLSLDDKVARIVARHMPYAGKQHKNVRIGGRLITEWFPPGTPPADLPAFLEAFRTSKSVRPRSNGGNRFLESIRFGGPMFGIFDAEEAHVFESWIAAGNTGTVTLTDDFTGTSESHEWIRRVRKASSTLKPTVSTWAPAGERQMLFQLVNIEDFPNALPAAHQRALQTLEEAEILFEHGARGLHTDASFFPYSAEALIQRAEEIYWTKLVEPYRKLDEVPGREEVIFGQKVNAFGSMVDGAWSHRIGSAGRLRHRTDGMLAAIYADEMGRGDVAKNHLTLIYRVLDSMGIAIPHIRTAAFIEQDHLPDLYDFPLHQLSLAAFPDTFYEEIMGYNLGVEMLGLGRVRLQEIQKLRRWGFDTSYEEAHLSIDNFSAGHARQAVDLIVFYLDHLRRVAGPAEVERRWERIWRGYASFAYYLETELVRTLRHDLAESELLI